MPEYVTGVPSRRAGRTVNNRATATNVGAGTITVDVEPDAGTEIEFIGGRVFNGDTVARQALIEHRNATSSVQEFALDTSLASGANLWAFDRANSTAEVMALPPAAPRIVAGEKLRFEVASVAAGEEVVYSYSLVVFGPGITVTETVN